MALGGYTKVKLPTSAFQANVMSASYEAQKIRRSIWGHGSIDLLLKVYVTWS